MSAYHWMSAKLAEKTCCYEYIYPRWVWRKYDGIKGWRTLKQVKESIEVAGEYVVLNLNIPEDRLLLSQFTLGCFYSSQEFRKQTMYENS